MKKRNLKVISFVMSVLLTLLVFPLSTIAYALENRYETLNEVVELRDENTKHFENPDGSYTAIMYNNAVHRKDSNGNWQDIDNTMSETEIKNKQAYITSDGRITFAKKIKQDENEIYTLSENGYRITVSFANENIKSSNAKLSNHASKYTPSGRDDLDTQFKKVKQIDNNTTLLYKNTLKGIDLEYVLSSNNVKENIIVKRLQDEYSYTFIYSLENLVATLNEDGSVSLFDSESGEERYSIPVPYMYDANGNLSYDVEYSLESLENGDYALTVSASSDWISSAKLPVVIDPTTAVTEQFPNVFDTYIDSNRSNVNFGSSDYLYISNTQITYMRPAELIAIPDRATVTNAELNVYYYFPNSTNANTTIGLYPVTIDWNENQLTWYGAGSYSQMGIDFSSAIDGRNFAASSSYTAASPGNIIFNITDLYKNAYAGSAFYGVALYRSYGSTSPVVVLSSETSSRATYVVTYLEDAPIASGEYFIKNLELGDKFLNLRISNMTNYITDVYKLEKARLDYQKWNIEYLHNGYYKITNVAINLSLAIPNNKTATADSSPSYETYEPIGRKQWKIVRDNDGNCMISPRSNESMYLSLATDSKVQQRANPGNDENKWRIISFDLALLLWLTDGNRGGYKDAVSSMLAAENSGKMSFVDAWGYMRIYKEDMIEYMDRNNVFIVHTHGNQTGFMIDNGKVDEEKDYLGISDLLEITFYNLDFALLLTCNTGMGYDPLHVINRTPVNIIEQLVISGVDTAVGFDGLTYVGDCNKFAIDLITKMTTGMSIQSAINAISGEYLNGNPKGYIENIAAKAVIAGNANYCLR